MSVLPIALGVMVLALALRFGRAGLTNLAALHLRGGMLALFAVALQLASIRMQQGRLEALLVSGCLIGGFCWLNHRQAGIVLTTLGILLNLTVMTANGGMMPISPETITRMGGQQLAPGTLLRHSKDIVLDDEQATLAWLGDRLLLPGPLAQITAWSLGDMLLLAGVVRLLWTTMKGTNHATDRIWRQTTPS